MVLPDDTTPKEAMDGRYRRETRVINRPKDHNTFMKPRDELRQDLGIATHAA